MGFGKNIRKHLGIVGLPDSNITERHQGCWNCTGFDNELAKKRWWEGGREAYLTRALNVALASPLGEDDPKVRALRKDIPEIDMGIERAVWGWCDKGVDAKGDPVQFVQSTYMCPKYVAKQGASVARDGGKMDELPADIMGDLNSDAPKN